MLRRPRSGPRSIHQDRATRRRFTLFWPTLRGIAFGDAPQRLCLGSSTLPWCFCPENCVEDEEQLVGSGNDRLHFGFSGSHEALIEVLDCRIVPDGGEGCDEQSCPYRSSAAGDEALAFPFAGGAGER